MRAEYRYPLLPLGDTDFVKCRRNVTGLGPGYIIPGPRPELTPLALWFRQEPPLYYCK